MTQVTVDVPEDVNWVMLRRDGKVFVPTIEHHRLLWDMVERDLRWCGALLFGDTEDVPNQIDSDEHLTQDLLSWMYGRTIGKMGEMADLDSGHTASPDEVDYSGGNGTLALRYMLKLRPDAFDQGLDA